MSSRLTFSFQNDPRVPGCPIRPYKHVDLIHYPERCSTLNHISLLLSNPLRIPHVLLLPLFASPRSAQRLRAARQMVLKPSRLTNLHLLTTHIYLSLLLLLTNQYLSDSSEYSPPKRCRMSFLRRSRRCRERSDASIRSIVGVDERGM
jgi:hypothetical protein